jgi:O-antigen ligase
MARSMIIPAYLALCLLLGGASAAGYWSNMLLQLLALPIIGLVLASDSSNPVGASGRQLLALLLMVLAVILVQLIPLPPSLWQGLPGRERIAAAYALLDQPLPWLTASLAPVSTIASALWLLPAVAVLVGIVRLGLFKGRTVAWSITSIAALSVLIGGAQVIGGNDSALYFYDITNWGKTTGFFANSNHEATLLLVTIPFATALYFHYANRGESSQRRSGLLVVLVMALLTVAVGLAINASSAGIALAVPVLAASALAFRKRRTPRRGAWMAVVGLLAALAIVAVYNPMTPPAFLKSEYDVSAGTRSVFFANTAEAVGDYFPAGSGIGTFGHVYPGYEDPSSTDRIYTNHAHNDYLELLLETGLPGVVVLLLFLYWWSRRAMTIWRDEQPDFFAKAATIASAAMLAHSIVDYPLRTAALSAVFAACCALMAAPRARTGRRDRQKVINASPARHLSA